MRLTPGLHRLLAPAATLTAALALVGLAAPAAGAANYHVWGCRTPTGKAIPAEGWTISADVQAPAFANDCVSGGSVRVDGGLGAGDATIGVASVTWQPGPGLTALRGVIYRYAMASGIAGAGFGHLINVTSTQTDLEYFDQTDGSPSGTGHGDNLHPMSAANRVDAPTFEGGPSDQPPVYLTGRCYPPGDGKPCGYYYAIFSYDFVVSDPTAPTVSAVTGSLTSAANTFSESAAVSGTRTVTVSGHDIGTGVYRAVLEVDGKEVASGGVSTAGAGATCSPDAASDGTRAYIARQPCPLDASPQLSWDTSEVPDGSHAVRVLLEDAAGNRTTAATGKVLVRNASTPSPEPGSSGAVEQPAVGPGSPLALRGAENGAVAGAALPDAAKLALAWPAKGKGKKPTQQLAVGWSANGSRQLSGHLTTAAGASIANARVRVTERGGWTGAPSVAGATAITKGDGSFTVPVAVAGGSRTILVQWFAHVSDTLPAAVAQVTLTVSAATSIAAPTHVRRGHAGRFTGMLRGAGGSLRAVPISIQALDHGTWKTVADASTSSRGKWAASVKFPSRLGRWKFRVRVGPSATYPYTPGVASSTISVRTS